MKTKMIALILSLPSISSAADYQHIRDAAIGGHNTEQLANVSVDDCKTACNDRGWCKSFDYYKHERKCDLSKADYRSVGLKSDYPGNPYDHYSKIADIYQYQHVRDAAISGHNEEQLTNVSVDDCKTACNKRDWCKSFDYYKHERKCDLSKADYRSVGLKSDYPGNPYDHYSKQ